MTRNSRMVRAVWRTIPLALATIVLCAPATSLGHSSVRASSTLANAVDHRAESRVRRACPAPLASAVDPRRVTLEPTGPSIGAAGYMTLAFARSPYGVTVTPRGRPVYRVRVVIQRLFAEPGRSYVAWAATPSLDRVIKLGVIGESGEAGDGDRVVAGLVAWNRFMVLVTAESDPDVERWHGPVLLTAVSPSNWMHTMRGHGIFARASRYC